MSRRSRGATDGPTAPSPAHRSTPADEAPLDSALSENPPDSVAEVTEVGEEELGIADDPTSLHAVIRIVVVASPAQSPDSRLGRPLAVATTAALARLGDPVEILRAETDRELVERLAEPAVDLVLVDRCPSEEVRRLLELIPSDGPPAVVVVAGDAEDDALEAFRAGAQDCVLYGPDFERLLPVVLLEQVRRWRGDRQRRESAERIQWLEDLYAAIVTEMPAALAVVDSFGTIVATNPEFDHTFPPTKSPSRTRSSDRGGPDRSLAERLPAQLLEAIQQGHERARRTEPNASEGDLRGFVRVDQHGAEPRAFEVRQRVLDVEGRILLLISDVTESEWLSDRLDSLRRDTRDIIDNINSALLVVDLSGKITFCNPAAEGILAGEADTLEGRTVADWFPRSAAGDSPIEECLAHGIRSRGAETLLRRPDGQWIPVGVSCSPRVDGAGKRCGVVAVFQDLSEIKELELQVRQTEKMASIGQLAAGVAHEVNNPMGFIHANLHQMQEYLSDLEGVYGAMEGLQEAVGTGDLTAIRSASEGLSRISKEVDLDYVRSDFKKALLESQEGAERIRHIVRDLRDFSRPDLPAQSPADINQAIDSTANIVWTMMKHTVHLEKDYAELPEIDAYPMQLKQVFMNLLVNAYQAIEARGEAEPGVIRIETRSDAAEVIIRVSDTGVGIADSDLARIFDPFFTTKPVGSGTGLGLSTCFSIVERHGGRIIAHSDRGRGSTFEVHLPISSPKRETADASKPQAVEPVRSEHG